MTETDNRAILIESVLETIATEIPGLSLSGAKILMKAAINPGMGITDLSLACHLNRGTGSALILNMSRFAISQDEPYGLLELRKHSEARHKKGVHLSPYGHTKVAAILASLDTYARRVEPQP